MGVPLITLGLYLNFADALSEALANKLLVHSTTLPLAVVPFLVTVYSTIHQPSIPLDKALLG